MDVPVGCDDCSTSIFVEGTIKLAQCAKSSLIVNQGMEQANTATVFAVALIFESLTVILIAVNSLFPICISVNIQLVVA